MFDEKFRVWNWGWVWPTLCCTVGAPIGLTVVGVLRYRQLKKGKFNYLKSTHQRRFLKRKNVERGSRQGGPGGQCPPNFWSNKSKCVFNKRTIKVCVSCSLRCPGTSANSAAHLTVSFFSVVPMQSMVEGPWRVPYQLKKPFEGPRSRLHRKLLEEQKRTVFSALWWRRKISSPDAGQ